MAMEILSNQKGRSFKRPVSISVLLVFLISVTFIVTFTLFFFNYLSFNNEKENYITETLLNNNKQVAEYTNNLLIDIESILILPLFKGNDSARFFESAAILNNTNVKSKVYSDYINKVLLTLFNYKTSSINSVFFYGRNGSYDYMVRGMENIKKDNEGNARIFNLCINDLNGTSNLFGAYDLYRPDNIGSQSTYVFGFARSVIDIENSEVVGVLQINVNENTLYNMLEKNIFLSGQRALIIDSDNNIISDTDRSKIGKKVTEQYFLENNTYGYKKIDDKLICTTKIGWTNWKIINFVPLSSISDTIRKDSNIIALVMIILMIFSSIFVFSIIMKILKPIKKLINSLHILGKGRFDAHIYENGLKETAILSNVFNEMIDELQLLVKNQYVDKICQKELELKMLQYQINPHFIFNSLESIKMQSVINNDNGVAQMLTSLGKLMRYSLSDSNEIVTVRSEIEMIEEFMGLLSIRFRDQYQFIVDVDENAYDYLTPKLILQPFIENAVEHGMSNSIENGEIIVKGYLENDILTFEINNNGKQLSEEKIIWLNQYINNEEEIKEHIGIKNVNKRLKLFFGEEYGVKIITSSDGYTTFIIKIPKIINEGM